MKRLIFVWQVNRLFDLVGLFTIEFARIKNHELLIDTTSTLNQKLSGRVAGAHPEIFRGGDVILN